MIHPLEILRVLRAFALLSLTVLVAACSHSMTDTRTDFPHNDNMLAGRLLLPKTPGPHPAVLIVHGDGDSTWNGYGYYKPFMQALTEAGFAVYSWDKPGVGGSSGNWLNQSMEDRADEVIAAANVLRRRSDIRLDEIGLLGFSQAGWVMPKAISKDQNFAFMVSVSGAINWLEQSEYTTRNRLRLDGAPDAEIEIALTFDKRVVDLLIKEADYQAYQELMNSAPECCDDVMSEERWAFVKLNFRSDAREDLARVDVPVLAVFGNRDMNVDFAQSAEVYMDILSKTPGADAIVTLRDADHMLLPALSDRYVTADAALTQRIISIEVFGADAFADGAIERITNWISRLDHIAPPALPAKEQEGN
ncbi:alpha/beta fold hydrolase [Hyphomonas sp.]|uniref:alpha/beta hydrolase family protein n=1 Tax=Hyphomonas sp. TaxID=87 RepID=UPI0025BFEE1D|nr:alpha/beta fold hydrolase [Hyphomonas sp.]